MDKNKNLEKPPQFETRDEYFAWKNAQISEDKEKEIENEQPAEQQEQQDAAPASVDFTKNPEIAAFIKLKVNEGIQKALQGKPPRANTANPTEQEYKNFDKMTYKERLNLFNTNPQAYNKLSKGAM